MTMAEVAASAGYEPEAAAASPESPAPGRARAAAPHVANSASPLFRHEALKAYQNGQGLTAPLNVVPLTCWAFLSVVGVALAAALTIATLGHVEITSRGRGVMRSPGAVQPLVIEADGIVRDVLVRVGEAVERGQLIARLDSTRLESSLYEAEKNLEMTLASAAEEERSLAQSTRRDRELLSERARLTERRISSQEQSMGRLQRQQSRYEELLTEGLLSEQAARDNEQTLAFEVRGLYALKDESTRIAQQLVDLERQRDLARREREQRLDLARSRLESTRLLLQQTLIRAPRAGRVESLLVSAGEVILAGALFGRLVSSELPTQITAFVPERDRAFVRVGDAVRLELDQLPVAEYGSARARIERVSSETTSVEELRQALGEAAPAGVSFRVDLALESDEHTLGLTSKLASGSLLTVRLPLRRRRVIGLIFDPIREYLD